jgi:hypothetical protein
MAVTVSLSTRVSPELRRLLEAEARARRVTLAELARDFLAAGVNDGPALPNGGDVQYEVACVFTDLPMEAGVHRAVCMALAKTVDTGSGGQVAAAKELLELTDWARRRYEPEPEDDEDEDVTGE